MELPQVSLDPGQPGTGHLTGPAGTRPHSVQAWPRPGSVSPGADTRGDGRTDARGDARGDGPGDGRADARAAAGPVLVFSPEMPAAVLGPPRSPAQRTLTFLAHWAGQCWHSIRQAVTNPRGPYHASPGSLADLDDYRRSRAWVPPGHEGRYLGPLGGAWCHTFARAGVATGLAWAWLWSRFTHVFIAGVVLGAILLGFWLG